MRPWAHFGDFPRHSAVLRVKLVFSIAILALGILAFVIGSSSSKPDQLVHTTARFMGQEYAANFFVAKRDKVKFTARKPARTVVTYIYPEDQDNFKEHALIPIVYKLQQPSSAYFAGPGGDVNYPDSPGYAAMIGFLAIVAGAAWWGRQSRWEARMLKLIDAASDQGPIIRAHWHTNRYSSTIVTASPATPWQVSWKALVIDSRSSLRSPQQFRKAWPKRNRILSSRVQAGSNLHLAQPVVLRSGDLIFLPLSRVAPVTLIHRASSFVNEDDELTTCHRQLLSAYADILNRIRQLPAVFPGRGKRYSTRDHRHFRTLFCWRFMVRIHVEAHIRRQLRNLANAYVRRQFSSTAVFDAEKAKLSALQEECNKLAESLSDNSRLVPTVVVILTIMAPIAPLILQVNPLSFYRLLTAVFIIVVAAIVFLPGTVAVVVYSDAFRFKRQVFGGDLPGIKSSTYKSVYELEDRLFGFLDQPKWSEKASDLWVRAGVITVLWVAIGRVLLGSPDLQLPILDWVVFAVVILPTWSLMKGVWYRRKAER